MKKLNVIFLIVSWVINCLVKIFLIFIQQLINKKYSGIEKHFHMAIALEKFVEINGNNVTGKELWNQLNNLYDLQFMVSL